MQASLVARARLQSAALVPVAPGCLSLSPPNTRRLRGCTRCISNDLATALPAAAWTTAINLVISLCNLICSQLNRSTEFPSWVTHYGKKCSLLGFSACHISVHLTLHSLFCAAFTSLLTCSILRKKHFILFHLPLIILPALTRIYCNSPATLRSWSALCYLEQCNPWVCETLIYVFLCNLFLPYWTESRWVIHSITQFLCSSQYLDAQLDSNWKGMIFTGKILFAF